MKRGIITNNGQVIHTAIKRILKSNVLKSHEVCKYIKLENGNNADVYNLDIVIALSYQIDTGHSDAFRKWVTNKVVRNQDCNILLYLNKETSHTLYC